MKTEQDIQSLWTPLPGESGEFFSIHGSSVASVQANMFILYQDGKKKFEYRASTECGSYPVWLDSMIYWNENRLDLNTLKVQNLDKTKDDFLNNSDIPYPGGNGRTGNRPVTYAWSPLGDHFLMSEEGTDNNGKADSRLLLMKNDCSLLKILWEGSDFAPIAACISGGYIIAGTRQPMIFNSSGNLIVTLPGELIPKRIHISETGSTLFIQTYDSITLWETGTWIKKGIIKGPWLNAAMSHDGKMVYAIDFGGKLNIAAIQDEIGPMKKIVTPDLLATVDAGAEYIVASFANGDPVRWALRFDLDSLVI